MNAVNDYAKHYTSKRKPADQNGFVLVQCGNKKVYGFYIRNW